MTCNKLFYIFKPLIPRKIQIFLRSKNTQLKHLLYKDIWPINKKSASPPTNWNGWPESKKFALVLTHDVELEKGQKKCMQLMQLEKKYGFRSSFNFVPERYHVSKPLIDELKKNNFEVGVHGLFHDGKLYSSKKIFQQRAKKINHYLHEWDAVGFRSPSMHHNLEWLHKLDIEYDASTFDTDPFEPQSDGVNTVFPFWVKNGSIETGYIELPYTLAQDFTQFILLKKKDINIWKRKLDWIIENGGMALLNTHPDYMNFDNKECKQEEYSAALYEDFLKYVKNKYEGIYWHVLPKKITQFWNKRVSAQNKRQS
jgi:hypothetical protein